MTAERSVPKHSKLVWGGHAGSGATVSLSEQLRFRWISFVGRSFLTKEPATRFPIVVAALTLRPRDRLTLVHLLVAALGWAFRGDRMRPLGWLGLAAGLAGVAVITGSRVGADAGPDIPGLLLCGLGATALAIATLTVGGTGAGGNVLMIVGLQMFVGAAALGAVSAVTETWSVNWTPRLAAAFAYTTLVPGLFATWVWFRLVNRIGPVRAATFHFLNPFFGVGIAWALLGEPLRATDIAGVAIVMAGILAVQVSRAAPRTDPAAGGDERAAAAVPPSPFPSPARDLSSRG